MFRVVAGRRGRPLTCHERLGAGALGCPTGGLQTVDGNHPGMSAVREGPFWSTSAGPAVRDPGKEVQRPVGKWKAEIGAEQFMGLLRRNPIVGRHVEGTVQSAIKCGDHRVGQVINMHKLKRRKPVPEPIGETRTHCVSQPGPGIGVTQGNGWSEDRNRGVDVRSVPGR